MENLEPANDAWEVKLVTDPNNEDIMDPLPIVEPEYYRILAEDTSYIRTTHATTPLRFTYTAMHGVGYRYIDLALKSAAIDMVKYKYNIEFN